MSTSMTLVGLTDSLRGQSVNKGVLCAQNSDLSNGRYGVRAMYL